MFVHSPIDPEDFTLFTIDLFYKKYTFHSFIWLYDPDIAIYTKHGCMTLFLIVKLVLMSSTYFIMTALLSEEEGIYLQ